MNPRAPISTILVANRGEIALRVIRTAQTLGLRAVAVYSDADRNAPHVHAADTAVHIGPTPSAESYLSIPRLIEAAQREGADAIHPGYGFLSERADFAAAVEAAGLTFIGPTADVIRQMGRKDTARQIALSAGVPTMPHYDVDGDPAEFDYPVLVKAAAGGGGKGMRVVRSADLFAAAVEAARRESLASFGDDTLLVERYVEKGKHIEVQILGDKHGNVVHLFDRDCSAQRRHQKIIEEAPAIGVPKSARSILYESALLLARAVGYTNAGTVEFLVAGDEVFFLEMNTRLQVEHPVTEAVTGLDLVALQISIAAGEPLPFKQDEVRCEGHSFEVRICAEDAWAGFLPRAGMPRLVRWPDNARVDAALEAGQAVGTSYDPMLGKIIVHSGDRPSALSGLIDALDTTAIVGLTTNVGFLRALAASPDFRDNAIDTGWLDRNELPSPADDHARRLAARAAIDHRRQRCSPFGVSDGWRMAGASSTIQVYLDGEPWRPCIPGSDAGNATVVVREHSIDVVDRGQWFEFALSATHASETGGAANGTLLSPMPGTVTRIAVSVGDEVCEGELLGVLEAMKMELPIKAPISGRVRAVGAEPGDRVPLGHELFAIELLAGTATTASRPDPHGP